MLRPKNI